MTELAVSVRLKADGSGLVGQVRQSTAEVKTFTGAAQEAGAAGREMAAGTAGAQAGAAALGGATRQAAAGAGALATELGQAGRAAASMDAAQRQAASGTEAAAAAQRQATQAIAGRTSASDALARASAAEAANTARNAAALVDLAQKEKAAADASLARARANASASSGDTIRLTEPGQSVTLSPGGARPDTGAAQAELAHATQAAADADQRLAEAARASATASAAASAANAELATTIQSAASAAEAFGLSSISAASGESQLGAAAREAAADQRLLGTATQDVAQGERQLEAAAAGAATGESQLGAAAREAAAEQERLGEAARTAAAGQQQLGGASQAAGAEHQTATDATRRATAAANDNTHSSGQQRQAMRDLGSQFSDFGTEVLGGIDPLRAFTQQSGQVAYALSGMGGRAGAVGTFLSGPWGAALLIGGSALAMLVEHLFDTQKAADDLNKTLAAAVQSADAFGNAESDLGKVIDLTTGKLKTHNLVLLETVRLQQQIKLATAEGEIGKQAPSKPITLRAPSAIGAGLYGVGAGGDFDKSVAAGVQGDQQQSGLDAFTGALKAAIGDDKLAQSDPSKYGQAIGIALQTANAQVERLAVNGKVAGKSLSEVQLSLAKLAVPGMDKSAALQSLKVLAGGPVPDDLKPYEKDKKPKKPKSTDAVDEFGRDAADRIANIVGQYGGDSTSAALEKTNKQVRALDDLIDDLGRKKPPNFEALIQSAEQAKTVVREGIVAELAKAFDKPKTLADQAKAAFAEIDMIEADLRKNQPPGFEAIIASAEKARVAIQEGLQRPFSDYVKTQSDDLAVMQLQAQGRNDEAAALKEVQALQRSMGPLTDVQKTAVLDTVEAMRTEQRQIDINRAHTQLYLDALGGIKTVVQDATQAFVRGDLGQLVKTPGKLLDIFSQLKGEQLFDKLFGDDFRSLEDQINGLAPLKQTSEAMADALSVVPPQVSKAVESFADVAKQAGAAADALGKVANAPTTLAGAADAPKTSNGNYVPLDSGDPAAGTIKDIVVVGNPLPKITRSPEALFESSLGKLSTSVAGLFTNPSNAEAIGKSIGKYSGQALQGAATGTMVAGIGNALGLHLSSGGSQIGGALGGLTGIPGGDLIGSVLGGLVGSLFAPKAKPGGVTIGNTGGEAGQTGTSGSDAKAIAASAGLGSAVSTGLNNIVSQLGGTLGDFSVSIGKYKDDLRVNTGGKALGGVKGSGAVSFGDDEAAAESYAISQAIAQGAVSGLSAAVQKALASSTDVDKALQTALKVQNLETLLGGVSGQLSKIFKDADAQAAERVDLAKKYGLDLLQVEKVNAEQRADLIASTLKSRVGSLQDLLTNLTSGDLADGSATDKRKALLGQIATAQTDAEAGKDGAADTLSQLYQQLLSTDKDSFGTAGTEYSADKDAALAGVQRVIQIETDRVNTAAGAQQATTTAVEAGNALVDEGNDLLVGINDKLTSLIDAVKTGGSAVSANLSAVTQAAR